MLVNKGEPEAQLTLSREAADLGRQRGPLETEHFGGGSLIAAGLVEGLVEDALFDGCQRTLVVEAAIGNRHQRHRPSYRTGARRGKHREVSGREQGPSAAQRNRGLDRVFQLTD